MGKSNGTAWLAATVALAAGTAGAVDAIPFVRGTEDGVVVPVTLEGRGPFPFLLDTAATLTRVDAGLAREAGLAASGRIEVVTVAGARTLARSSARLGVGPHVLESVDVLTGGELPRVGVPIRGVLGQSALARISYGIDYRRRRVVFDEPSGRRLARVPLAWREGRPAAVLRDGDARPLALVLDSGLDEPVLFEKPGHLLPYRDVPGVRYAAATTAGRADLRAVTVPGLDAGPVRLGRFTAAVVADAAAGGRAEDGLLPARLFASVYFDRERGEVALEPR
jgi:aspartyl protease